MFTPTQNFPIFNKFLFIKLMNELQKFRHSELNTVTDYFYSHCNAMLHIFIIQKCPLIVIQRNSKINGKVLKYIFNLFYLFTKTIKTVLLQKSKTLVTRNRAFCSNLL